MFESAELGHKIEKATYLREVPKLREALLNAQYDLVKSKKFPVIIVIGGVDGAGKGETVNLLNEWMDPRHIQTHAFPEPSDEERERPRMWRFWRALPPKGKIGILFGAWHTDPIVQRALRQITPAELEQHIDEIVRFERMLIDEGALIIKVWLHLSKERQKKRLRALENDPDTRWRVTDIDWGRFRMYDRFGKMSEHYLRHTSTGDAPWTVVEGEDERYRSLTVGKLLLAALRERLGQKMPKHVPDKAPPLLPPIDKRDVLGAINLSLSLPKKKYNAQLEHWQGDPHKRIPDMDADGIDAAFLYPSLGLFAGAIEDPRLAAAMCRAYNRWLADYCKPYPDRLFGVAMLPLQDVDLAIKEMTFARKELGMRGGFIRPNPYNEKMIHHPNYEPFWAAAEDLDFSIGFHEGASSGMPTVGVDRFEARRTPHHLAYDGDDAGLHERDLGRRLRTPSEDPYRLPRVRRRLDCSVARSDGPAFR